MKIINAMFGKGLGGIEQVFLDYADNLPKAGINTVNLIRPGAQIAPKAANAIAVPSLGSWDPVARTRLTALLRKEKPDIVICHGSRALRLLAPAARKAGAKLVGVAHNYWLKHFHLCDAAIALTPDLAAHLQQAGVKRVHIHTVPNMVRVPSYPPMRRPWTTPPVIGTMGRMVHKKGFDLFLDALRDMNQPFTAIIAGDGEEAAALRKQAESLGMGQQVTFTGWVHDRAAFWNSIDLFCLPSRHEPFGVVLLEAMAEGLPVVSTPSEGPSSIITQEVDGLIAKPEALSASLDWLLSDPQKAKSLGRAAYTKALNRYSEPVVTAELKAALELILRRP